MTLSNISTSAQRLALDESSPGVDPALVRSIVLLAGGARRSALARVAGRCVLDLPIKPGRTLLEQWWSQVEGLRRMRQLAGEVRIQVDAATPPPRSLNGHTPALGVAMDALPFRGSAGVLRDIAVRYDAGDYLLVGHGAQVLVEPLGRLVDELAAERADVSFFAHADGTPTSLMLVRCGVLFDVPAAGYVDFKEQALPRIAEEHRVRTVARDASTALPVRTPAQYVAALRWLHRARRPEGAERDDRWAARFGIAEPGAKVGPGVMLHDAVVLAGGRVQRGATVVRSVVGPGGVVRGGRTVVDGGVGRRA